MPIARSTSLQLITAEEVCTYVHSMYEMHLTTGTDMYYLTIGTDVYYRRTLSG